MNRQTIFTIVLVVVLGALGVLWYGYLAHRSSEESGKAPGASVDSYQRIKDLRLNIDLFTDPAFRALKQEVVPPPATEAIGRSNPFLPF